MTEKKVEPLGDMIVALVDLLEEIVTPEK